MRDEFRTVVFLSLVSLMASSLPLAAQPASGAAQPVAPYRLTLQDALQKALQANLSALVGSTQVDEAEGARQRSFSAALLPRVTAQTYANVQNRDLRAFGISLPGMPEVVGPFSNYDIRVYAQQNLIDLQSRHNLKASERAVDASKTDLQNTRDLIVRAVAALYLNAESAAARAQAAQSRVTDSTTLYKLAKDKHDAGTATGVDVLRAEVQLANDKQTLLIAENQHKQSLLTLARNLGMNPGTPLELAEPLHYASVSQPEAESLVPSALTGRADYQSLALERQQLVEQQRANHARSYPRLSINGNYGELGRSVGGMKGTGMLQGQIDFTVFDADRTGEAAELASRLKRVDEEIADLRRGIDEEIREALLNLDSANQQVSVAEEGQNLARRELELAQDRFQSGTANNVEVVTAQDELARAEENYILAVTSHVDAKFALARAQGDTEKNILLYLGNP